MSLKESSNKDPPGRKRKKRNKRKQQTIDDIIHGESFDKIEEIQEN